MTRAQPSCRAIRHFWSKVDRGTGHKRGWAYLTVEIAETILVEGVCRKDVCNLSIYLGTTTWANASPFHLRADIVLCACWL